VRSLPVSGSLRQQSAQRLHRASKGSLSLAGRDIQQQVLALRQLQNRLARAKHREHALSLPVSGSLRQQSAQRLHTASRGGLSLASRDFQQQVLALRQLQNRLARANHRERALDTGLRFTAATKCTETSQVVGGGLVPREPRLPAKSPRPQTATE
jgi:hypothetical protein